MNMKQITTKHLKERKLTAKQKAFAEAFVKTNNASEAVRIAKYDALPGTITNIASTNLAKPTIQAYIRQMKQDYVVDSYEAYQIQKDIMRQASQDKQQWELTNKIANKIQDRAGFMPVAKQENKSISMKYVISRGKDEGMIDEPLKE